MERKAEEGNIDEERRGCKGKDKKRRIKIEGKENMGNGEGTKRSGKKTR